MDEIIAKVRNMIRTLERMDCVRGRDNLDRMLGCILALEKVADQLSQMNVLPEQPKRETAEG